MIYLYGLSQATSETLEPHIEGLIGLQAAVEVSQIGQWALLYSQQDDEVILPKRRLMLAHTKVLEKMLPLAQVLPARFGLVAESLEVARGLIEAQNTEIASAFARVEGCVEIGVRISFDRPQALSATLDSDPRLQRERDSLSNRGLEAQFDIADFGGRLAERLDRRRGDAQSEMIAALRPLVRNHVLKAPDGDTQVLRAEFLLESNAQDDFLNTIQTAAESLAFAPGAEPKIDVIGPAPLYHFVQLSLIPPTSQEAA